MTYNVHSFIHLSDDVERHGPLDSFTCFPFETQLYQLKRMSASPVNVCSQICRRALEDEYSAEIVESSYELVLREGDCIIAAGQPYVISQATSETLLVRKFADPHDWWERGITSSELYIFKASSITDSTLVLPKSQVICKCLLFNFCNDYFIIPLPHMFQ